MCHFFCSYHILTLHVIITTTNVGLVESCSKRFIKIGIKISYMLNYFSLNKRTATWNIIANNMESIC